MKLVQELQKDVQKTKEDFEKKINTDPLPTIEKIHAERINRINKQLAGMKDTLDKDSAAIREIHTEKVKLASEVEQLRENVHQVKTDVLLSILF